MKKPEMSRDEKTALVRRMKTRYFSLQGKTPPERHMMEALIAACDVIDLNEVDLLKSYNKGFMEGRLYEAKQAKIAQGDSEIVGDSDDDAKRKEPDDG